MQLPDSGLRRSVTPTTSVVISPGSRSIRPDGAARRGSVLANKLATDCETVFETSGMGVTLEEGPGLVTGFSPRPDLERFRDRGIYSKVIAKV